MYYINIMARAFGYTRVSTLAQVNDGHGLDVQRAKIDGWCAYQGVELVAVESDAGISGGSMENRPGLKRVLRAVLEAAADGKDVVLVVYKLDRLGRNAIDVQETLAVLLDAGVRVVSLSDGVDSASGMGAALLKLLTSILATFAELEKENIRTRLLDGRKRADAENRTYASEPRYGRRVVDHEQGKLDVDPEEARAVERIRSLRAEGLSYREIIGKLDAEGIKPRHAEAWSLSVVHRIATGKRAGRKAAKGGRIERARAALLARDEAAA